MATSLYETTLFGRDAEAIAVANALTAPKTKAVVARAPAGAGKTALMQAVLCDAARAGALIGSGRHLLGDSGDELAPFVLALEQAIERALDTLYDPAAGLSLLRTALGPSASVLAQSGAGALRAIGAPFHQLPITGPGAVERAHAAVFTALRWLSGFGRPVVLLIDDWGRARGRAKGFYDRLISTGELQEVRLLATERTSEPFDCECEGAIVRIELPALSLEAKRQLVSARTGLSSVESEALLDIAGESVDTPFDLIRVLVDLQAQQGVGVRDGQLQFDQSTLAACLGKSGCELFLARIKDEDASLIEAGKVLALFGEGASIEDLSGVLGCEIMVAADLVTRLQTRGLAQPVGRQVRISHDKFAEALSEIDAAGERARHFGVAEYLRQSGVSPSDGARGVLMLERFCASGVGAKAGAHWPVLLSQGAAVARSAGDMKRGARFAETALALFEEGDRQAPFGALCEGVYAAVEQGDNDTACQRAERLHGAAQSPIELAQADELCVFAHRMSGDLTKALVAARRGLARLGVKIPERASPLKAGIAICAAILRDPRRYHRMPSLSVNEIEMQAPMMRAINAIGSLIYEHDAALAFLIGARSLPDAVIGGTAAGAAVQAFLCAELGLYKRAEAWAELSDARQSEDQPLRAVARQYVTDFAYYNTRPRLETGRGPAIAALAYSEGDLVVASYSLQHEIFDRFMGVAPLQDTARRAELTLERLRGLHDTTTAPRIAAMRQVIEKLTEGGVTPWHMEGRLLRAHDHEIVGGKGLQNTERGLAYYAAILGVAYGAYDEVVALYDRSRRRFEQTPFHSQAQHWTFLTALALYKTGRTPSPVRLWLARRHGRCNPSMNAHKIALLKAEAARRHNRAPEAISLYASAVLYAREAGSLLELGIVAEAAREGCVELGDEAAAQRYSAEARAAWARYGAWGVLRARGHPTENHDQKVSHGAPSQDALAEAAMRESSAKSRLMALVGHELRTPLQGLAHLLDSQDVNGSSDLRAVRKSIAQLTRTVSDLVDFAAAESGVLQLANAPFDLRSMLDDLVAEKVAGARPLKVAWRGLSEGPSRVSGDEMRLRQILSNLIGNALTHAQSDVEVVVSVPQRDAREMASVRFEVLDRGPGLPVEDRARLFEPFERGARGGNGLGLGLSVAWRLARAMQGDIILQDREDRGAACVLTVQLRVLRPGPSRRIDRVLLVEDDDASRAALVAMLRQQGCNVVDVDRAGSALSSARTERFDLIVADAGLDDFGGEELLTRISNEPQLYGQPALVLMSAQATAALEQTALRLGADFLTKPLTVAGVRALLKSEDRSTQPQSDNPRLEELRAILGETAPAVFGRVRGDVAEHIQRIENALAVGDWSSARTAAHKLAGLASHFGFDELARAALKHEGADAAAYLAALDHARVQTAWSVLE